MRVLSSWEAAETLERAQAEVRPGLTRGYTLAGPCPEDRQRLMRLSRAARQLSRLNTDDSVDTRKMRAEVEDAAQGRLTGEETAGLLSLRPHTCGEALLWIPTLYDFSVRSGAKGELPGQMPSLARVIAIVS